MENLPGDYVAGFVDGEGCFYLTYRSEIKHKRAGAPKYFRWTPYFAIVLRKDDIEILEKIKDTLGCGRIFILGNQSAQLAVQNIDDLYNKIMPFFKTYPLRAKKRGDFELWCQALTFVFDKKIKKSSLYSIEDNKLLSSIRTNMKAIKSLSVKAYKNNPIMEDDA